MKLKGNKNLPAMPNLLAYFMNKYLLNSLLNYSYNNTKIHKQIKENEINK